MGLEHAKTSVDDKMAVEAGYPTVTVNVATHPVRIDVRVVTKPLVSSRGVKYNYFVGQVFIDDEEVPHNGIWQYSPREAVEDAIKSVAEYIIRHMQVPYPLFPNAFPLHDGHREHAHGYWVVEGTHGWDLADHVPQEGHHGS